MKDIQRIEAPVGTNHFRHMERTDLLHAGKAVQSIAEYPGGYTLIAPGPVTENLHAWSLAPGSVYK